jgi:hypothetical protein
MRGWVNSIAKTRSFTWNIRKEQETGLKNNNPLHLLQMRYTCCYTSNPHNYYDVTLVTLKSNVLTDFKKLVI